MKSCIVVAASVLVLLSCQQGNASGAERETLVSRAESGGREIVIGNTAPLSGPAAAYGLPARVIEQFFADVNAEGGVGGHKVRFLSRDDRYDPDRTADAITKLVEEEQAALILGSVGTPTNQTVSAYLNRKQVPHLFLLSGHPHFDNPRTLPYSIGWPMNYVVEGQVYGAWIKSLGPDLTVGVLYQNDSYGEAALRGLHLGFRDDARLIAASYDLSERSLDNQISRLAARRPDFLLLAAVPKFAIEALREVAKSTWRPTTIVMSQSSSAQMLIANAGRSIPQGVLSAGYLKSLAGSDWQGDDDIAAYRDFMARRLPDVAAENPLAAMSYALANVARAVLERAGPDFSRASIMRAAHGLSDYEAPLLLPGVTIDLSANDHLAIEAAWIMQLVGERYVPLAGPVRVDCCAEPE